MNKYCTFNYCQYADGKVIDSGNIDFKTSAELDTNDMKVFIRKHIVNDPAAVITIQNVQEISEELFLERLKTRS